MPRLTPAEKQRRYRERRNLDTSRKERNKEMDRIRWQHKSKAKVQATQSKKEQERKRRYWRQAQKKHREKENNGISKQSDIQTKRRKNMRAIYTKITNTTRLLEKEKRRSEMYRKRCLRKTNDDDECNPSKIAKKVLNESSHSSQALDDLTLHYSMVNTVKDKYHHANRKEKKAIVSIFSGKIIRKYKLLNKMNKCFGFNRKLHLHQIQKSKHEIEMDRIKKSVTDFYQRDDVSRMMPGKKATKTKKKVKVQKRLLNDSIANLHAKFLSEVNYKISYSLFCRLRPFWVVSPTNDDRQTCQCKTHENLEFMARKLHSLKILQCTNIELLAQELSCDAKNKDCMYGKCIKCKTTIPGVSQYDPVQQIEYQQWQLSNKEREVDGEIKKFKVTEKVNVASSLETLVKEFGSKLSSFRNHLFNIRHQYQMHQKLKETMTKEDCLIHIDFSENYSCKYNSEIQSVHFGGSHQQATLHTGVLYVESATMPFCSISPSRQHDPTAIWAHLEPVFDMIKKEYPAVKRLHFYSDGPTTQYRQKGNFYLFSKLIYEHGFQSGTWNFWEASHGKGAPDGIGGALKRKADKLVCFGKDIVNAKSLYEALKDESSIILFYIPEEKISNPSHVIPMDLPTLPGTMQLHQIISKLPLSLEYRDVSCVCGMPTDIACQCFSSRTFDFKTVSDSSGAPSESTSSKVEKNVLAKEVQNPDVPPTESTPALIQDIKLLLQEDPNTTIWCAIRYDGQIFPGTVQEVDIDSVLVSCLKKVGRNRFCSPLHADELWYNNSDVLALIEKPSTIGSRHLQVEPAMWLKLEALLYN